MAKKRGRHKAIYRTSWGEELQGLSRYKNRWRISETDEWFTEENEVRAIQHFKDVMNRIAPAMVTIERELPPVDFNKIAEKYKAKGDAERAAEMAEFADLNRQMQSKGVMSWDIPDDVYYARVRDDLINRPELLAEKTGIPELKGLRYLPLPKNPLKLEYLLQLYLDKNPCSKGTKSHIRHAYSKLISITQAKTIDDLTTEKLKHFKDKIMASGIAVSGASAMFNKVKAIFAFALKEGEDSTQLSAVLGRLKVLYIVNATPPAKPKPISKDNFHKLLNNVDDEWRAMLLLALNCSFYIDDLCNIRWDDIDIEKGTYAAYRKKSSIARAAVLWSETIAVLKRLPKKGPYIFTSNRGTKFNTAGRYNTYKKVREKANVNIEFSSIRDATYTTAVQNCEEKFARVLSGHVSVGLQDRYVLRNPQFVKPACDAVYTAYGPFPERS